MCSICIQWHTSNDMNNEMVYNIQFTCLHMIRYCTLGKGSWLLNSTSFTKTYYKLKLHTKPKQTEPIYKIEKDVKKQRKTTSKTILSPKKNFGIANGSDHIGFTHAETTYILCSVEYGLK